MENTFKVRFASLKDVGIIACYQNFCAMETEDRNLDLPQVRIAVRKIILSELVSLGRYLVVDNHENKVVACSLLQLQYSDWACSYYMNVESVYVEPESRGKGAFQLLYEAIEDYAKEIGDVTQIRSTVAKTNIRMHKVLSNIDWEETKYLVFAKKLNLIDIKAEEDLDNLENATISNCGRKFYM